MAARPGQMTGDVWGCGRSMVAGEPASTRQPLVRGGVPGCLCPPPLLPSHARQQRTHARACPGARRASARACRWGSVPGGPSDRALGKEAPTLACCPLPPPLHTLPCCLPWTLQRWCPSSQPVRSVVRRRHLGWCQRARGAPLSLLGPRSLPCQCRNSRLGPACSLSAQLRGQGRERTLGGATTKAGAESGLRSPPIKAASGGAQVERLRGGEGGASFLWCALPLVRQTGWPLQQHRAPTPAPLARTLLVALKATIYSTRSAFHLDLHSLLHGRASSFVSLVSSDARSLLLGARG